MKHFTKERQGEALTRFVLLLSDQQVLTGLAVLIRAIANGFCVTGYELLLVVSLTWFPATTHLTSLDILRKYSRENHFMRNARPFAIIANFCLLITAFLGVVRHKGSLAARALVCSGLGQLGSASSYF